MARPAAPGLGGHFAVADLGARLQGKEAFPSSQALDVAALITASFRQSLPDLYRAPTLIRGPLTQLLEQSLLELLKAKGAWEALEAGCRVGSTCALLSVALEAIKDVG